MVTEPALCTVSISQPKSDGLISTKVLNITSDHYSVSSCPYQPSVFLLYDKRAASSLSLSCICSRQTLLTLPNLVSSKSPSRLPCKLYNLPILSAYCEEKETLRSTLAKGSHEDEYRNIFSQTQSNVAGKLN